VSSAAEARRQRRSEMILVATVVAAGLVIAIGMCLEDDRPMSLAMLAQRLPCLYFLHSRAHALQASICQMAGSGDVGQSLLPWKLTDKTSVLTTNRRSQMGGRPGLLQITRGGAAEEREGDGSDGTGTEQKVEAPRLSPNGVDRPEDVIYYSGLLAPSRLRTGLVNP